MKKYLLSGVALIGLATVSSAFAADLPRRVIAPPPMVEPMFTWTGLYVGATAGYGWGVGKEPRWIYPDGSVVTFKDDSGGFTGGLSVGALDQTGSFVYGVEADLQYLDLGGYKWGDTFLNINGLDSNGIGGELNWYGSIRGRVGYAFDRTLIYATSGFAFGGGKEDKTCQFLFDTLPGAFGHCQKKTGVGLTVGGGVEYAITDNITIKGEGMYLRLHRKGSRVLDSDTGDVYRGRDRDEAAIFRLGVNYKFSSSIF